ncbi:N(6)-adenine-specific methyltransferase METTL4 isoform X2 [Sphaerodactylus townsendi]|uniref:N(6)-adenine-specific methyltransferase METTL4 isoform X2 n=1 Tax=Sphaerodactylus townsendi TaxID=933632 RepID=UPI002026E376|nr:N(6)-adenine-specific methyltransferase METTL4 isoform X2 [Sphaerodactylus townsendi]XP_048364201.1 N(6)-adenine-specific methyltransferase METTL4 isoform X2 [Sphaerodactylus townsendi]
MAIVHCQSAGWLLDHLFFINKSGYQLRHSHEHPARDFIDVTSAAASSDKDPVVAATQVTSNLCGKKSASELGAVGKKSDEMLKKTFLFRREFFNVFKPHIAADFQKELQQQSSEASLEDKGSEQQEGAEAAKKKRKRRSTVLNHGECDALEYHSKIRKVILEGTRSLVQEGFKSGFLQPSSAKPICSTTHDTIHSDCGLAELCEMAKQYSSVTETEQRAVCKISEDTSVPEQVQLSCVTENVTNDTKLITLMGHTYLFPPQSSFLLSDISCMQPLLNYNKKFGVIVIDPPWENKSVKRSNRYSYLSPWQIKQIPVPALAAPECLVVTWVTNRQKHIRFVKNELYPHWAVHGVTEWYWVKITRSGEFVFPLDSSHKKPYEILVLGRIQGGTDMPLRISGDEALPIPDRKLIVSVPCTLHSHKPPLTEILKEYTRPDVECLELFARHLQPGWTSWGNEVLKFQHMDYFTAV